MKILVTGANGYLGQGIVKELLDNGHNVVAADFKTTYVDDRAEKVDCDLFSVEEPYIYFGKPDVLLHLAWRDGFVHYSENHIADLPKHYHFPFFQGCRRARPQARPVHAGGRPRR